MGSHNSQVTAGFSGQTTTMDSIAIAAGFYDAGKICTHPVIGYKSSL